MIVEKYCTRCAETLIIRYVEGRERKVCVSCGLTHYENPVPAACVVLVDENEQILLTKRNVEPGRNLWCLPGGFIELGESPEKAAIRELEEETGLKGRIHMLLGVTNDTHPDYYSVLITAYLVKTFSGQILAGDDVSAAGFYEINNLPEIAFDSHRYFIRHYFSAFSVLKGKKELPVQISQ